MQSQKGYRAISCAAVLASMALTSTALANEPATQNTLNLGLGFRYGQDLEDGDFNPWGPGLGIEIGYTFTNAVYVGGNFDYFFGEVIETDEFERSGNIWQLVGEGGYDLGLGNHFVIRPKAGVGFAGVNGEVCVADDGCEDSSETALAIVPGSTFMLLTSDLVLSLDVRYDIILAEAETLNALLFSVGVGF